MKNRSLGLVLLIGFLATVAFGGAVGVGRCDAAEPYQPRRSIDREVQVTGRVTALDRNTGVATLQVGEGKTLVFQFTPQSLANLYVGDRIIARTTFSTSPSPQLYAPAGDAPPAEDSAIRMEQLEAAMGQSSVTGTVQNLNRMTGQFDVQTATALLRLEMRPETVQELQPGQTITVDMGFSKENP
jgi:hypothetical protein